MPRSNETKVVLAWCKQRTESKEDVQRIKRWYQAQGHKNNNSSQNYDNNWDCRRLLHLLFLNTDLDYRVSRLDSTKLSVLLDECIFMVIPPDFQELEFIAAISIIIHGIGITSASPSWHNLSQALSSSRKSTHIPVDLRTFIERKCKTISKYK